LCEKEVLTCDLCCCCCGCRKTASSRKNLHLVRRKMRENMTWLFDSCSLRWKERWAVHVPNTSDFIL